MTSSERTRGLPTTVGVLSGGRMGAGMVRRLMKGGHQCVVYDMHPPAVQELASAGAVGATSLVAAVMPQLSILCLLVLVMFYVSLAWIDAEQTVKVRDLVLGDDAEKIRVVANNNVVLMEARERNADVH
jgi:6-phosphogluconate dehydrogenase (decarboxylating)